MMTLSELSFVHTDSNEGMPKINAWAPARTDDFSADCAQGRAYFQELRDFMVETANPTVLPHILHAQMVAGIWGGVEIGFAQAMSETVTLS